MTAEQLLQLILDEVILIRQAVVDDTGSGTMNFLGTDANGFYILIILIVFSILFMRR